MESRILAISIPTFNRTQILHENLLQILPELKQYNIPVYISDNGYTGSTEEMVVELKREYSYIYYHNNQSNRGHDINLIHSLLLPKQQYVWLLGDSMQILPGLIDLLMDVVCHNNYDFIGVNTADCRADVSARIYSDELLLFKDLYWHLTLTSATIYSRNVIEKIENINLHQYRNFPQTGLIFNIMSESNVSFYWTSIPALIVNSKRGNSYWKKNVLETFLLDYSNAIMHLPENYNTLKAEVLLSHAKNSRLFSLINMLNYRYVGAINLKLCNQFKVVIKSSSGKPYFYFYFFSILPQFIAGILLKFANSLKSIRNSIR